MKKLISISVLTLFAINCSLACDICGGGLGNTYTGLLPNFNKRFIGIRYHFNQLYTQLDIHGNRTAISNKEKYNTVELWGAWNVGSRWRVMAIVPYSQIQKYSYGSSEKNQKSGLGDLNISGLYNLINKSSNSFRQSLWVGIGVKLPVGTYNKNEYSNTNSPNIYQLGTGSTDFTTSINYDIRYNNLGLNTNMSYKINTENKDDYLYGNKLTVSGSIYYNTVISESITLRPNVGLMHETQEKDHTMGYKIDGTGGYNTNINMGIEANIKNIALGFTYQKPTKQEISQGRTQLINKFLTHITFTF
ncbi:transporter [Sphingobacterium bovistauri]|uniref:Transporter n=1 Tax=Sphingobacterium bovistauri TaxID=2781959 RepID=A0ABS7Z245_9SPHI|nr:transporter [Sphingobacterium bovistauri]MCA5003662.1 transporter [Sphingobacterium bovistauri]